MLVSLFDLEDFIAAVLLTAWLDLPEIGHFEVVEFFSGKARISRFCARMGLMTGAYDITYDQTSGTTRSSYNGKYKRSYMDINSNAGFLFLAFIPSIL